jgi:nucleoside-diphosphate-sugar epimerase
MVKKVIIITGASGFVGSSLVVELSKEYTIIGVDKRKPSPDLIAASTDVKWIELDIADISSVNIAFQQVKNEFGRIDIVIHLAAFYHFGNDWLIEYDKTNINGTENILNAAIQNNAERIIFASSVAAMAPPSNGKVLNEQSPASDYFPYARSKAVGEKLIGNASEKIPAIILRLGGVFSDWCELPPLYSLIQMWSGKGPLSRIIPGKGKSGIPYIHVSDVIQIIKHCIRLHDQLESFELFIASQKGAVMHKELFSLIKKSITVSGQVKPVYLAPSLVKKGLYLRLFSEMFTNNLLVEQPWMLEFIDRPWIVDNRYTQQKLNWECSARNHILNRLPVILKLYEAKNKQWIDRKRNRILRKYEYLT